MDPVIRIVRQRSSRRVQLPTELDDPYSLQEEQPSRRVASGPPKKHHAFAMHELCSSDITVEVPC